MAALRPRFPTMVHALLEQVERGSAGSGLTLILESGAEETQRCDTLLANASRCAAALAEDGVGTGDRVVLCLPTGPQFITAFFGAQLLGAVPTAIAVPTRFGGATGVEAQLKELVGYLQPAAVITTPAVIAELTGLGGVNVIDGDALYARAGSADAPAHPTRLPDGDDLAFIQCTSGSTGKPKGVMVSHTNLVMNMAQMAGDEWWTDQDTTVSWLPLYHDMGLITGVLCPIYTGANSVLMPTTRFLRAPAEWLQNIAKHRGTISAAPNFAYGYAAARVRDEDLDGVDLSSWRIAICGAEPIQPVIVKGFARRFARWGLSASVIVPAYGMAEATLGITNTRPGTALVVDAIDRKTAVTDARAVDVDPHSADAMHIVNCGEPVAGTEVRIVDAEGNPLADSQIGHVQFRGPSRTVGYFNLPEVTAASIDAPDWWKTGDIGYMRDGGLRITDRAKDLIIIRGANYYPSDFEQVAQTVPGIRLGAVIAVGYRPENGDSEELHLIAETELDSEQHEPLRQAVRAAVSARTGVVAAHIHLVPIRSIPKTTSGKLQRAKARKLFVEGTSLGYPALSR